MDIPDFPKVTGYGPTDRRVGAEYCETVLSRLRGSDPTTAAEQLKNIYEATFRVVDEPFRDGFGSALSDYAAKGVAIDPKAKGLFADAREKPDMVDACCSAMCAAAISGARYGRRQ